MIFANLLVLAFLIGCVTGLRSMTGPSPLAFLNSTFSLGRGLRWSLVRRWLTVTKYLPDLPIALDGGICVVSRFALRLN
jgi:hypothetical protein